MQEISFHCLQRMRVGADAGHRLHVFKVSKLLHENKGTGEQTPKQWVTLIADDLLFGVSDQAMQMRREI